MFTNEPRFLWSYWSKVHEIFTRYRGIICAVNVHTAVAHPIPFRNTRAISAGKVGNFATKLVALAMSLEESEKLVWIEKIHANTFHLVGKKIVKIGPVDPEIALLMLKKKKKLT